MSGSIAPSSKRNETELAPIKCSQRAYRSWESTLVGLISFVIITLSAQHIGVWELSESLHARLIKWMWTHQTWLQVNVPLHGEQVKSVAELAMGWWPSMLSVQLFSHFKMLSPELALRLPSLILSAMSVGALYSLMRAWRATVLVSLIGSLLFMITPAFTVISRHSLSAGGIGVLACTLSCLCFWRASFSPREVAWRVTALISLVASAGSLGLVGLIPLLAWLSVLERKNSIVACIKRAFIELGPVILILSIYAWRSWIKRPDGVDAYSLFLVIDSIGQTYDYSEWKGFQGSLHLIGFGLFPLGALLPIIAYTLRRADEEHLGQNENLYKNKVLLGRALNFHLVICFFSVSLLAPVGGFWGAGALLLSAPFAVATALFLTERRVRFLPPAMYTLSVVLFWLLLHSDVKREPALLISALTGESTEGLLPNFTAWRYGKLLSLTGLLIIIAFKTSILRTVRAGVLGFLRRPSQPRHHPILLGLSFLLSILTILPHLISAIPRWVVSSRWLEASFWNGTSEGPKLFLMALMIFILSYHFLFLLWRTWGGPRISIFYSRRDLEWGFALSFLIMTPHYLDRLPIWVFMKPFIQHMESADTHTPKYVAVLLVHMGTVLVLGLLTAILRSLYQKIIKLSRFETLIMRGTALMSRAQSPRGAQLHQITYVSLWLIAYLFFSQVILPKSLSAELSHQGIVKGYQEKLIGDEPLKLYLVKEAKNSYYLSALSELDRNDFIELAKSEDREIFVIDRSQLSRANSEFRQTSGRHLPVIDDRHHELLLATNQLAEGELDLNPIKKAVINELPEGINRLEEAINFENKIELVAWRLNPAQPRPGAPLKIDLFWRAIKRVRTHWKVFIHIDAPGQRIHADHEPVLNVYPTEDWQEGDLIVDTHHITVKRSIKPATFTFFAGLYRGKTRMKIMNNGSAHKDKDNRAILGKVWVR